MNDFIEAMIQGYDKTTKYRWISGKCRDSVLFAIPIIIELKQCKNGKQKVYLKLLQK